MISPVENLRKSCGYIADILRESGFLVVKISQKVASFFARSENEQARCAAAFDLSRVPQTLEPLAFAAHCSPVARIGQPIANPLGLGSVYQISESDIRSYYYYEVREMKDGKPEPERAFGGPPLQDPDGGDMPRNYEESPDA